MRLLRTGSLAVWASKLKSSISLSPLALALSPLAAGARHSAAQSPSRLASRTRSSSAQPPSRLSSLRTLPTRRPPAGASLPQSSTSTLLGMLLTCCWLLLYVFGGKRLRQRTVLEMKEQQRPFVFRRKCKTICLSKLD